MNRLHIDITGHGPSLVLLHGWAMHGGIFAPLLEQLRTQRTLYVVDLPGHGFSRDSQLSLQPEPCVHALLDVLPVAPWCGWSLGGLLTMQAALLAPARVPAAILLCAAPKFVRDEDWPQGMAADVFHGFAAGLRQDWRNTIDRFIALEAYGSDHMQDELNMLCDAVLAHGEPSSRVLAEGLDVLLHVDLRDRLPSMKVPSLWLAGRRDRLVNPLAMQTAAALAGKAQFMQIEHAGHAPFLTHAVDVANALKAFLVEQDV